MINNRQNGRRRGRGGQPQRGGQPGVPDRGNRLDNRARGNAAQLLEKYKTLARDAQMQGDRVNTEYYLQFADHYFRVLSESRSRFEEQNQRRPQGDYANGDYGDGDGRQQGVGPDAQGRPYDAPDNDGDWDDGDGAPAGGQPQDQGRMARDNMARDNEPREQRDRNEQRPRRNGNNNGGNGNGGGQYGDAQGYGDRNGGYQPAPAAEEAPERIEFDRIPPSLTNEAAAAATDANDESGEEVRPRRRPRRPRETPVVTDA